jgi:hypothetical protein
VVSEKIAANEQIRETQVRLGFGGVAQPLPFLCECDDVRCRYLVRLKAEKYASARAAPTRRIVAEGHPYEGRIIVSGPGYVIAEV